MKNIKTFLFLSIIFSATTAFATWSQPTATPPAGNTQPPINTGSVLQYKKGTLGAYEFCLYKSDGTKLTPCLGGSTGGTATFPWVYNGADIENTNDETANNGNVNIKDNGTTYNWIFSSPVRKLNVEGMIKAVGFCLGNDCISTGTTANTSQIKTFNSWKELVENYSNGGAGDVVAGPLKTNNYLTKWIDTTTNKIANSLLYEETGKICLGTGASKSCITNWSDIKNGVTKIIAGTNVTITSTGTGGTGDVTVNSTATGGGDVGPGTANKISKFTASDKIGDSNISDNGTVVEVSTIPLKAANGLIIPKVTTDTNSLEEGAIWLNTSVTIP